ncbi:MAG: DUF3971 domain-containing protein [Alphaproteobacteria bacterium]|nr:DUF3971 domain-containing protein [Alphaproteobacteria bacterium]
MAEKHIHICKKAGYWGLVISITLGLTLVILGLFFVWRVHQKPLDLGFAKGFIEAALYDRETGNSVQVKAVDLFWPNLSGALLLRLSNSVIVTPEGQNLFSADQIAMSFSRYGLIQGRLMPKHIIITKPSIQLKRLQDGGFSFGFTAHEKTDITATDQDQSEMIARIMGYIARPGKHAVNDSIVSRLEGVEIREARLRVADDIMGMSWSLPDFSAKMVSAPRGMIADFSLPLPEVNGNESGVFVKVSYFWDNKNTFIEADMKKLQVSTIARQSPLLAMYHDQDMIVDLELKALLDNNFLPDVVKLALWSEQGIIAYPDIFDAPIPYKDMVLETEYSAKNKQLSFGNSGITLNDDIKLSLESQMTLDIQNPENMLSGPISLEIKELAHEKINALWPKALRGDGSEKWIVKRMSDGTLYDLWATAILKTSKGPDGFDFDAQNVKAGFSFKNMSVDYRAPLDPVTKANGKGTFDLNTDILDITVEDSMLGSMKVKNSRLVFDEVAAVGKGNADMHVELEGKIKDIFQYISKEPINLGDRLDMDISEVKGHAALNIGLKFPTKPGVELKEFDIDVTGTLTDTLIPDVVQNLDLSGGPLDLVFTDGLIKVSGKGMLEKREMDFSWEEFLESEGKPYKSKVSAKITADPNIRTMLGIDLSDFIEGPVPVTVDYTSFSNKTAKAKVTANATPALFFVEPFNFAKAAGEKGQASFTAHFKNNEIQNITDLKASGSDFSISGANINFTKGEDGAELESGDVKDFSIGETKGTLNFQFDKSRAAKILMNTSFLDAQPFFLPADKDAVYDEPAMQISVTAKSMRTAPQEIITSNTIYMDIDDKGRFNQLEMDGIVGGSELYVRFKPDAQGKRTFRLQTDNAGAFLKAFQVYDNIRGGQLVIYGEPINGVFDRSISGQAELTGFKVVNAPALASLLGIMSLTGIADVLSNDGLDFNRLEANFNWIYRKGGSLLVLKNGTTSGNSIGLTFDGTFDNAERLVDVAGTIIPMSGVNNFIGKIPLVGDILTGGSGSVFAATYSIKGPSEEPVITFNPLSVLTPGILRRILFEKK